MSSHDRTLQPTVKTLVFSHIACLTKDRTDDMKFGVGLFGKYSPQFLRSALQKTCSSVVANSNALCLWRSVVTRGSTDSWSF